MVQEMPERKTTETSQYETISEYLKGTPTVNPLPDNVLRNLQRLHDLVEDHPEAFNSAGLTLTNKGMYNMYLYAEATGVADKAISIATGQLRHFERAPTLEKITDSNPTSEDEEHLSGMPESTLSRDYILRGLQRLHDLERDHIDHLNPSGRRLLLHSTFIRYLEAIDVGVKDQAKAILDGKLRYSGTESTLEEIADPVLTASK